MIDENVLELALSCLNARERKVIEMRFPIYGGSKQSLNDIGKLLQVSGHRIRQIQEKSLRKMRRVLSLDKRGLIELFDETL
jgi:RNA polymerase sigma factor (sigma-70 family)